MKKLMVVLMVLSMATMANATLTYNIGVGGVAAGNEMNLDMTQTAAISILGSGDASGAWLIVAGPGTLTGGDISHIANEAMNNVDLGALIDPEAPESGTWGAFFDSLYSGTTRAIAMTWVDSEEPFVSGFGPILFDGATLAGTAMGDVTIAVVDFAGEELVVGDVLTVHITPEPMTMGLLGLGGLFLRRRSK